MDEVVSRLSNGQSRNGNTSLRHSHTTGVKNASKVSRSGHFDESALQEILGKYQNGPTSKPRQHQHSNQVLNSISIMPTQQSLVHEQPQVKSRNQNMLPSSKTQTDSMYKRSSTKKVGTQKSTLVASSRPATSSKPVVSYGVKPSSAAVKKSTDKTVRRK